LEIGLKLERLLEDRLF